MGWARHVAEIRENNAYRLLAWKLDGGWPLGRRRRRWVDNIKMDLVEIDWVVLTGFVWPRIGTGENLL
jgi:hypothetical protein